MGLGEGAQIVAGASTECSRNLWHAKPRLAALSSDSSPRRDPYWFTVTVIRKRSALLSPVLEVLRLIPNASPELIESSCCGMAGSSATKLATTTCRCGMMQANLLPAVLRARKPSSWRMEPAVVNRSHTAHIERPYTRHGCWKWHFAD